MKITIDLNRRTSEQVNPSVFAAGEVIETEIILPKDDQCDGMKAIVYTVDGNIIGTFEKTTEDDDKVVGAISTRYETTRKMFAGKRFDQRIPAILFVGCGTRVLANNAVEIVNNPEFTEGEIPSPIPAREFVEVIDHTGTVSPPPVETRIKKGEAAATEAQQALSRLDAIASACETVLSMPSSTDRERNAQMAALLGLIINAVRN